MTHHSPKLSFIKSYLTIRGRVKQNVFLLGQRDGGHPRSENAQQEAERRVSVCLDEYGESGQSP